MFNTSERSPLLRTNKNKRRCTVLNVVTAIVAVFVAFLGFSLLLGHSRKVVYDSQLVTKGATSAHIRGGDDASGFDFPWVASWRFDGLHCCTGSLIHKNPIIIATAAHCVTCEQTTVDLRRTLTDATDPNAESHAILYWVQHSSYESPSISSNDVALVVLEGTTDIEPIDLAPPKVSTQNVFPPGTAMDILGYGFIDEDDTIISRQLQRGSITAWSKSQCFAYLDEGCNYGDRWDNNAMLCGYDPFTSTERGDSGGPALMNGLLSGINSWSPPTDDCRQISGPDYQILDVFVDIGSVRHWIEDNKPTQHTYFIGVHFCADHVVSDITEGLSVILHGSNGGSSANVTLSNVHLTNAYLPGDVNVFVINDLDNIGWVVNSVVLQASAFDNDAVCIDMVTAGRVDGAELTVGASNKFWMQNQCIVGNTPCYSTFQLPLSRGCGAFPDDVQLQAVSSIDSNTYVVVMHVCSSDVSPVGGSLGSFNARMYGVSGTTEWFALRNSAMNSSFSSDGMFIFSVDVAQDIGVNINAIELQNESNDALCIDMVTAGHSQYPFLWKGNRERFFIDNPCDREILNGVSCFEFKTLQLSCYDL